MWGIGKLAVWALLFAANSSSSAVFQLGNETFLAHVEANPLVLVGFCVPWYEPCQSLYPELETTAEALKSKAITVVNVDCTTEAKLCASYNVTSYPALRVFRGPENVTRCREKRKSKSITSYMIRQILPLVSTVTASNIEELLSLGLPVVVAYLDEDDTETRELFASVAGSHQDKFLFGISSDVTLARTATGKKTPFIMLYSDADHINRASDTPVDVQSIETLLSQVSSPLIGKFSLETYYTYTQSPLPLVHIFAASASERQSLAEVLQPIAEKYRGKLNFATIDAEAYGFFADTLGLTPGRYPAFAIEDVVTGDSAPLDQNEEITREKVRKFVEKYFKERSGTGEHLEDDRHDEL